MKIVSCDICGKLFGSMDRAMEHYAECAEKEQWLSIRPLKEGFYWVILIGNETEKVLVRFFKHGSGVWMVERFGISGQLGAEDIKYWWSHAVIPPQEARCSGDQN